MMSPRGPPTTIPTKLTTVGPMSIWSSDGADVDDVVFAVDNKPVVDNVLIPLPEERVITFVVDYLVGVVYAVEWYVVHRRHVDFCQHNLVPEFNFVALPCDLVPVAEDIRTVASEAWFFQLRVVVVVDSF